LSASFGTVGQGLRGLVRQPLIRQYFQRFFDQFPLVAAKDQRIGQPLPVRPPIVSAEQNGYDGQAERSDKAEKVVQTINTARIVLAVPAASYDEVLLELAAQVKMKLPTIPPTAEDWPKNIYANCPA
jgi:hypothetical protein